MLGDPQALVAERFRMHTERTGFVECRPTSGALSDASELENGEIDHAGTLRNDPAGSERGRVDGQGTATRGVDPLRGGLIMIP